MPPIRLPNTDVIVFLPEHIGDFVADYSHYPEIDDAVKNEDVFVVGDWQDFTGSAVVNAANYQGMQDIDPSSLKGQVEDPELDLTERGKLQSTHRQRPRLVYIDLTKENAITNNN